MLVIYLFHLDLCASFSASKDPVIINVIVDIVDSIK